MIPGTHHGECRVVPILAALLLGLCGAALPPTHAAQITRVVDAMQERPPREGKRQDGSGKRPERRGGARRGGADGAFLPPPEGVWPVASLIVARPGDTTIDVNVLAANDLRGRIEYWPAEGKAVKRTTEQHFRAGEPTVVRIAGLSPNTAYRYRFAHSAGDTGELRPGPEYGFHTQRVPESTFVFEVQGDSHPERPQQCDPALYAQTLRAASADKPDFYIAMGDDFSVDTLREVTPDAVERIYLGQRHYLGLVGNCAPLLLVNGNHEQASRANLDGSPANVAVWAQTRREKYFSQPAPEGIYTGNEEKVEHIGLLRNYFAWTWGDALFVVIDPYWHSKIAVDGERGGGKGKRDLWDVTLGEQQYRWLKRTLEQSQSRYKFVFTHHVLGTGRGGVERAGQYEWGGRNNRGDWEFDRKRPGWELPIHQLMAQSGVSIFFQGHDHVFCKQELDGVIYQTMPQPGDANYAQHYEEAYREGDALPSAGRVRVTVAPEKVKVEYVRSFLPADVNKDRVDGSVAYSYTVVPGRKPRPAGGR